MNKETAAVVNNRTIAVYQELNEILWVIKDNCPTPEFKHYQKAFGRAMGEIAIEIMEVLYKEHPELRPPELTRNKDRDER